MKSLAYGWTTERRHGSTIYVNGKKVCNTDTMMALQRAGFVEQVSNFEWKATEAGKQAAKVLGL